MRTGNFPRAVIIETYREFPFSVSDNDWLISISDLDATPADVKKPFDRVLFMSFNDVPNPGPDAIQDHQAQAIAAFIKSARELQKNVWVNCHAGVCRSGAIAHLCSELGWEPVKHYLSPNRIPNTLVYNKIRVHFEELRQSWDT